MRNLHSDSEPARVDNQLAGDGAQHTEGLANRLLTAREVARFVGCHEEDLVNGKENLWLFGRSAGTWAVARALAVTIPGTST